MRWLLPLAVCLCFGLSACGGTDSAQGDATAETTATSAGTTEAAPTTSEATTTTAEPERPREIRITFRKGKLGGDAGTVRVSQGEQLKLIVRADVEDEVHVHGYDLAIRVAPGHAAQITFVADQPGTFTIELEERHLHIAKLRVGQ